MAVLLHASSLGFRYHWFKVHGCLQKQIYKITYHHLLSTTTPVSHLHQRTCFFTEAHVVPHSIRVELPGWHIDTKSPRLSVCFLKKDQSWELCPVFWFDLIFGGVFGDLWLVFGGKSSQRCTVGQQNVRNINQLEGSFPSSKLFVHMMLCDEAFNFYTVFFLHCFGWGRFWFQPYCFPIRSGYIELEIAGNRWQGVSKKSFMPFFCKVGRMVVPAAT